MSTYSIGGTCAHFEEMKKKLTIEFSEIRNTIGKFNTQRKDEKMQIIKKPNTLKDAVTIRMLQYTLTTE